MKNLKYYIVLIAIGLCFFTCKSDLLEENPTNVLVASQFFQTAADAEIALAGAYDALQSPDVYDFTGYAVHWGNKGVDELNTPNWVAGGRKELHLYQITPNMIAVENIWAATYKGINVTNGVIDRVGQMSTDILDEERKTSITAEARFIRAVFYFAAVRVWENIPLITSETINLDDLEVKQASTEEVYAQIIDDLTFAEETLEEGQGGGRATKGAAAALLGKVYLQMTGTPLNQNDKFDLANQQFEKVILSGTYSLQTAYSDVFDYENEDNSEILFAVKFDGPGLDDGGRTGSFMGPNGAQENGGGWGTEYINTELATSYAEGDDRLCHNVAKHNVNNCDTNACEDEACLNNDPCGWRPWKWHKPKPNIFLYDSPMDFIYLRYADILLSKAEAVNRISGPTAEAYDLVNQVTSRSNAPAIAEGLDADGFADALLAERRLELCFEGHRKDDLIRFGKLDEIVRNVDETCWSSSGNPGGDLQSHEYKLPIPQREIDLNPSLVQNEGY